MNKTNQLALACLLGAATLTMAGQAAAELTANIGVTNNYIWRGVTQTDDSAAVSGGLDYSSESGFYVGTWASNIEFAETGTELDLYFGYAGEAGDFGYDVGYIYYAYPSNDDSDFQEIYASGSYGPFSLGVSYQVDADFTDENYVYVDASYEVELSDDYGLTLAIGNYDWGDDLVSGNDDSYFHYGATLSKGEFSLGVVKNDIDGGNADDPRFVVSWSREF